MASSSSTIPKARRYDVFLSFRGDDTRNGFTSHLHEALSSSQISTFIDNNLRRGDNISPSLLTAIEESNISVIIFSEDYANSRWCLQELIKIFQCKERNGQIVIPVFYGVDPSHVRKQIGNFGANFDKLKERLREGEMDLNEVRSHLEEAANISGWNSHDNSPESELIKSIVGDILKKLNQMPLKLPSSLVGIGSQVKLVESLLCLESPQFRMVGLWGMGGIGKTTVAKIVYHRICSRFDAFHFVENVSQKLKNQSVDDLREKIVLKLFEEEYLNMGSRTLHHDFIMKQLQCKKVLIALDDVDNAIEVEKLLAGENDLLFSGGSRVLVTSRDKQILKNIVGDQNQIHEVEALNNQDGLQLFSLRAFKQNHPTSDRLELSRRVLSYARGNPLALVVLGCALFDKSKEEWVSALDGLGEEPFPDIKKVLRISYDALCDQEKTIFLDIASFLIGKTEDFVVAYYKESVIGIKYKISNLDDKSLITISEDKKLGMHDLLKEMGRSIESAKRLEERTRIWNLKDITQISKERKESSRIEAISVNLSQGERISEFDCSVLARLDCLRFLEFHHHPYEESKVRFCWKGFRGFPKRLRYFQWDARRFRGFSEELRYFKWDKYPQKSLPSNFCFKNLVELHMEDTAIRELWTDKQDIVSLKVINLRRAYKLVEFPDVSNGRNIQEINLDGCRSLVNLPPSIQHLPKLVILNLGSCTSVKSVPTTFDSKVIEVINLNGCGGVKMFPQLTSQGNTIRELNLKRTDIIEVPSSVELLKGLKSLSMLGCKKLSIISTNICKLKSLSELDLRDCTNLESFPEIMEPMESLTRLDLSGCTELKRLPNDHSFHNLKSLEELRLDYTAITELPSSIQHLICLKELSISNCQNLTSLPSFIHNLRMTYLKLSCCERLCSLPADMKQVSQLLWLDVAGCSKLRSLPELPSSLEFLDANSCFSLKTISSACFGSESKTRILKFADCKNWDMEDRRRVLDIAFSNLQSKFARPGVFNYQGFQILQSKLYRQTNLKSLNIAREIEEKFKRKLEILEKFRREMVGFQEKFRREMEIEEKFKRKLKFLEKFRREMESPEEQREFLKKFRREMEFPEERKRALDLSWTLLPSLILQRIKEIFTKLVEPIPLLIIKGELTRLFDHLMCSLQENLEGLPNYHDIEIMLPWSTEIPQWFCGSQSVGSSLTLKLPMDDQCYRFAFCVVIKPNDADSIYLKGPNSYLECYVDGYGLPVTSRGYELCLLSTRHLLLWQCPWDVELRKYAGREVSLQFRDKNEKAEVTRCGVMIL